MVCLIFKFFEKGRILFWILFELEKKKIILNLFFFLMIKIGCILSIKSLLFVNDGVLIGYCLSFLFCFFWEGVEKLLIFCDYIVLGVLN